MQNEIMERRQSSRPPRWRLTLLCGLLAASVAAFIRFGPASTAPATSVTAATPQSTAQAAGAIVLAPTAHPPIPRTADELWLVPASAQNATRSALMTRFSEGVDAIARSELRGGDAQGERRPPREDADCRLRQLLHRARAPAHGTLRRGAQRFQRAERRASARRAARMGAARRSGSRGRAGTVRRTPRGSTKWRRC